MSGSGAALKTDSTMLSPNSDTTPSPSPVVPESSTDAVPLVTNGAAAEEEVEGDQVKIIIRVSEDKLSAYASVQPPPVRAKSALDSEAIIQSLLGKGIGISYLDLEAIQTLSDAWNKTQALVEEIQVAETTEPPVAGENARIEYLVDPNLKFAAQDEGGSIDFKNLNLIKPVKKGQPLARKHTATKSAPGIDLFGQSCIGIDGTDVELPVGTNTRVRDVGR